MGLGVRFVVMVDILRSVHGGKSTIKDVIDEVCKQPLVRGSEVLSLCALAKRFGFLKGENEMLSLQSSGLEFMKYVESLPNPMDEAEENQKLQNELNNLRKGQNDGLHPLIQQVLNLGGKVIETSPDLESYNTRVTVTLPPRKKIPLELRDIVILNEYAEKQVIEDCQKEMYIVSPYIDVNILQMLFHQSFVEKAHLTIITSDEKLEDSSNYYVKKLRTVIEHHFGSGRIMFLSGEQVIAHAKMWLSEKSVLITSANIVSNSQTNNFELGIFTDSPVIINACKRIVSEIIPSCKEIK